MKIIDCSTGPFDDLTTLWLPGELAGGQNESDSQWPFNKWRGGHSCLIEFHKKVIQHRNRPGLNIFAKAHGV
jgi:hypothetical protein